MLRIPDSRIDQFIAEDVPYIDLTSEVLGIGAERGEMEFFTREACVLAGVSVARRIAEKCGCEITSARAARRRRRRARGRRDVLRRARRGG